MDNNICVLRLIRIFVLILAYFRCVPFNINDINIIIVLITSFVASCGNFGHWPKLRFYYMDNASTVTIVVTLHVRLSVCVCLSVCLTTSRGSILEFSLKFHEVDDEKSFHSFFMKFTGCQISKSTDKIKLSETDQIWGFRVFSGERMEKMPEVSLYLP